jgi:hypothetical protein
LGDVGDELALEDSGGVEVEDEGVVEGLVGGIVFTGEGGGRRGLSAED